jgi:cell division protein FtsI/penicillin-binding protein 2
MTRRSLLFSVVAATRTAGPQWIALQLADRVELHDWPALNSRVSLGSLLKPFLVVAYGATHAAYPVVRCLGALSGCWFPPGHDTQDVIAALANSCNTYFLHIAQTLDRAALETVSLRYGLQSPDRSLAPASLIGLSGGWPQSPLSVARAFAALAANASDYHVQTALHGMARCATQGTARAAGFRCYAKTGTAPCTHVPRAPGDGFAVAIYPPEQPRHLLLVERHSTTGANAARDLKSLATSVA